MVEFAAVYAMAGVLGIYLIFAARQNVREGLRKQRKRAVVPLWPVPEGQEAASQEAPAMRRAA